VANALFYLMAALSVVGAGGVVLFRNPISNVLSLLLAFFALAAIYLLCGFQFLAAAQILVYVGAIMVLFLFVIMLLNLTKPEALEHIGLGMFGHARGAVTLVIAASMLALGLIAVVGTPETQALAAEASPAHGIDTITATPGLSEGLAGEMFGRYLLPFEAVSMLLLATAVAVVVLAKRNRPVTGQNG